MKQRLRRPLATLLTVVMLLGLLPTAAFAVEDETGAVGETKITQMTLQNFKPFGEDTVENVDLLKQSEPLNWEATGSNTVYTINFTVELDGDVTDKSLRITLPYGMQFVGLVEENGQVTNIGSTTIESVEWEHSDPVYENSSNSNYQRNNGTLIVHFPDEGASSSSFSINVQPDVAFLPTDQKDSGFLIKDAIQAQVQVGDHTSEPESVDVKLFAANGIITSNGGWNKSYSVVAGTSDNKASVTVYWQYLFPDGGGAISYFMDKAVLIYAVPNVFTITDASMSGAAIQEISVSEDLQGKYPDCTFYSATYENFYGAQSPFTLTFSVDQSAEMDRTYIIYPVSTEVRAHGQVSSSTYSFDKDDATNQVKIKVIDPEKTYLEVKAPSITLTNYTELGNEAGNFDDYNMLLSYVEITNRGVDKTGPLIYEAQFDANPGLIRTAIRIPCQADRGEYPTELTICYGNGQSTTLDGEAIQGIATILNKEATYSGIEIQLADVTGLQAGAQVTGFKAQISGLNKGYENGKSVQERYTSAVIGRIAAGVEHNSTFTDNYRVYSATASEDDIPKYTIVPITISNTPGQIASTSNSNMTPKVQVNGETQTTAQPGDTIQISDIGITPTSYYGAPRNMLVVDPIFYIIEPAGLNLSSVSFTDGDGNPVYATKTEVSPTNGVEIAYGGKLYAYQLNNTLSGYWDGDMEAHSIQATVEYNVPYGVQTAAYDLSNLMFWASGISGTSFNTNFPYAGDLYGLNNGKYLGGYRGQTISVTAPQDLAISSAMQIQGTDEWFVYDGTPSSVAVFGNNTTASVRVTVRNNTTDALDSVEIYVPIPKAGTKLGTNFGLEGGYYFDMYVAGPATVPDNWQVQYGVVKTAPVNDETPPTPTSVWSTSYTEETNMVKISMTEAGGLSSGESAEIILKLRATDNASQNDQKNLFKSWYTYEASSGSGFDASETMNFGALLQIGELTGTVYADSDRDSTKNAEEQGVENVRVTVTDGSGRVYEDRTDDSGQYTISGLPSNQELTVTVYNPYSHENRAGAHRFSDNNPSGNGTVGSDVTSTDSGQTGTITLTSLTGGKGVVNAGLVEPYHVQFKLDRISDTGYVTPAELYVFPGQTLSDVTDRITVVTPAGQDFLNQWEKSVDSTTSTVENSALLTEKVTADTIYTAQTQTRQSTVNATWWDAEVGTLTKKQSWTVEFGQKVPSTGNTPFPTDDAVNVRPGYDFKGWEVNGDSTNLEQRTDIIDEQVYAGVNYVAHYEPKTDITVTLKANGGTFGDSDTLTLSNLTYGGVVNNAVGYKAPTREDYYFIGWAENDSAESGAETLMVPTESKTYYAVWAEGEPENVTVSFDRMGGEWTERGASSFTTPLTGKPGTSLTLPTEEDIERTGYTFDGWYTDYNCSVPATDAFPSSTATWYAKWDPHKHTVTYDYNDGKVAGSEETKKVVENLDYDSVLSDVPAPQKPGYELIGWRITTENRTDTGYIIPSANMTERVVDGDITYEAYYVEAPVTVSFNANRYTPTGAAAFGDGTSQKIYQNLLGEEMPFTDVPVPSWEGYVFVGWEDDEGNLQSGNLTFTEDTNYYARWEEATFTVTYRLNGGTVNDEADDISTEVTYKGTRPSAPAVTLPGSTLAYWLDMSTGNKYAAQANEEEGILAFPTSGVTSDEVYLAIWNTNQYTVTFTHYDYSQTGEGYGDSSRREVPTIYNGTPAAPAVVPPAGQAFDRWLMTAPTEGIDGQTKFTANELLALKVTQDMTFQAVFKATDYTVTFDANGGQFAGDSVPTYSVAYNAALSTAEDFAAPTVTKTGSKFRGWTKTGDDTLYTNNAQDDNYIGKAVITSDTVFIASWSGDVRVTFNANGGTISDADYAEGQAGTAISIAPTPTRYGYTFGGWYTDSGCENSAAESDGSYKFPAANATWYAKWTAKDVTVVFDYGEGKAGNEEQKQITKAFGSTLSEDDIPAPTLAGSTLTGWSREDGTIIPNSNMTSEVIGTEGQVTYTAYYTANPITITFDPNGGTFPDGTTESKSYMKSEGDTMPFADVPVPTKDAHTFAGWKLQEAEESSATTTGSMTFDTAKTYVAVWTGAEYTITFRLAGGTVDGNAADVVKNAHHGDTFPTAPNVTLSGNTLQGWLNMADGKMYGGSNQAFPTNVTESATYIAIWGTNTYKVTFTKYDYSNQDAGDDSTLTIPTIYQGIPAAPTVTPPTGRQFTGWKITSGSLQGPEGTLEANAEITSAELTQCRVIGAVTLEAQYSDPTYTVTFNPGEDAQLSGNATYQVTNGKTMVDMNFTVPTASKDGATSTSWICSLNGEAMTADEIKELVINRDVTFTAVWVGDVTVSFVLNGGTITNGAAASVTGAPGTEVTVPLVEQDGYTFEGWYDAETSGNSVTFTDNKTTIGDTSVTYYARWTQNSLTVEPTTQTTTYTGIPATLTWMVKDQQTGSTLTADDYDVTYFNRETGVVTVNEVPTEAGTYTVTFRGKNSYLGKTATATYTIEQADLSSAAVTVTDNSKTYNGSEQYASVNVTLGNTALIMGQDFTVTYDGNCVDAGSYSITVNGIGNYKGEYIPTEQLAIAPKELQDGMIQAIPPQYYTGQEITPEITVHDGELVLHEGTDFENVTYSNNIDVGNGTASVSITGKGNYTGDAKATFSIIAKSTYLEVSVDPASATYGDDLSGMTISVSADGTALAEDEDYTLSFQRYNENGELESVSGIDEAGVYIITATGKGNYDGSKGSTVFILYPRDESDGALVISQGNLEVEYDGENHLPTGFTVQWNDGNGTPVDLPEDEYELLYSYNNSVPMEVVTADTEFVNVGIYVVTVKADGNYSGIATFVVTITPKDISDSSVDVFIDETTYNAGEQTADITVTDGPDTLKEGVDYTVANNSYTDANEDGYEVLITGEGNYTGSRTGLFIIHRAEIAVTTDTVSITYGDPLPDISTVIPSVNGIYDADAAGVTVTLAWPTDLSAGTHELTASLSGDRSSNYVVDASGALLIVSAKDMNGADSGVNATLDPDYGYYTGSPLTPNVVVTDSKLGTTLTEGRDYTVSYEDSNGNSISQLIDLGSYTVIVTGKGNYTGTFELVYTIQNKPSGGGGTGGGGGSATTRYTIEAEAGRGGEITPDGRVRVDRGDNQTFRITADEGYEIADVIVDGESVGAVSSYTFENVRKNHTISVTFTEDEPVADPDDTGVSGWLNTSDHIQYLSGYGGGKFGPTDNMTRAQAAQMFYNLLLDQDVPITVHFTDVAADAWYAKAVNTLASLGIVDGIGDNHYAPERAITRAEFTVIAMRFAELDTSGENIFSDVTADAWYYDYVVGSIQYGWINGYEDGTFRPNNTITRSEVTAIVNRMLGRSADKVFVDRHADELTQFSDVPGSYWAYYEIMEAANAHDYVKDNGVEDWTRLQ